MVKQKVYKNELYQALKTESLFDSTHPTRSLYNGSSILITLLLLGLQP